MKTTQTDNPAKLNHILITSENPEALGNFYRDALGMTITRSEDLLLCEAPRRRVLIGQGAPQKLGYAAFVFPNVAGLRSFSETLRTAGTPIQPSPSPILGSEAFAVTDPDDNIMVFGLSPTEDGPAGDSPDARLQHFAVATTQLEMMFDFYTQTLGFKSPDTVEDEQGTMRAFFINSDQEHHTIGIFKSSEARLDHHAYDVADWNAIRDWADHVARFDIPMQWGPGRHGPGNNLFFMVHDPDENWVEFSTELEQLTPPREPVVWPYAPKTLNLWGEAYLRS
ncbi:MAG: VOC family protein [Arenicellales bacterium]|jgi:catechol-2,3-dioxygenase|nr:VOC family protein [Arenicellales bacterium]